MGDGAPEETPEAGDAAFVFGSVTMRRGGVTRATLQRMRCFAEAGIRVRLFLTRYGSYEQDEEAAIRAAWSLPESVKFRYFWRDAPPGGGGAPADPGTVTGRKHFAPDGRLVRIDQRDAAGAVLARAYFDPRGRFVLSDHTDPETGTTTVRRWFDSSGACWLTTWLDENGKPRKAVRHTPQPVAYEDFGCCAAEWVDAELADASEPVVFSDERDRDSVLLSLRHPGARLVAVIHSTHIAKPYSPDGKTKRNYLPILDPPDALDAIVVTTARQRDRIIARHGGTKIKVINHAAPEVPELTPDREPGLLAVVSRFEPQKGVEDAIKAFARAANRVPQARLDIYGIGTQAKMLEERVTELELGDRVRFRGFTHRALEVLASASATVSTSRYEAWGMAITEAMAVGTPVIAYDVDFGPGEIIRHGVDGLLVPPTDIDALAEAMVRVLGDPDYAARLGARAREVSERFSAERWRAEWLELFTAMAEGPPRRTTPSSGSESSRTVRRTTENPQTSRRLRRLARASTAAARRSASRLAAQARARSSAGAGLTAGPVPGDDGTWRQGYYRDGLPVLLRGDGAHHVSSGHDRRA
jgi:poly(glycerol-phosphate) alpha-glucosyltransferase